MQSIYYTCYPFLVSLDMKAFTFLICLLVPQGYKIGP